MKEPTKEQKGICPICSGSRSEAPKPIKCIFYKDVGGVYTADPKIVPEARLIPEITYDELMEMGNQGAKVVHPRAVEIAQEYGVELFITAMEAHNDR